MENIPNDPGAADPAQPAATPVTPQATPAIPQEPAVTAQGESNSAPGPTTPEPVKTPLPGTETPTPPPENPTPEPGPEQPSDKPNKKKWAILIGVGVVILGIISYLLAGSGLFKGQIRLQPDDTNRQQIIELEKIGVKVDTESIEAGQQFDVSIINEEIPEIKIWSDKDQKGNPYADIDVVRSDGTQEILIAPVQTDGEDIPVDEPETELINLPENCIIYKDIFANCDGNIECQQEIVNTCEAESGRPSLDEEVLDINIPGQDEPNVKIDTETSITLPAGCSTTLMREFELCDNPICQMEVVTECNLELGEEKVGHLLKASTLVAQTRGVEFLGDQELSRSDDTVTTENPDAPPKDLTLPDDCTETHQKDFNNCDNQRECQEDVIENCKIDLSSTDEEIKNEEVTTAPEGTQLSPRLTAPEEEAEDPLGMEGRDLPEEEPDSEPEVGIGLGLDEEDVKEESPTRIDVMDDAPFLENDSNATFEMDKTPLEDGVEETGGDIGIQMDPVNLADPKDEFDGFILYYGDVAQVTPLIATEAEVIHIQVSDKIYNFYIGGETETTPAVEQPAEEPVAEESKYDFSNSRITTSFDEEGVISTRAKFGYGIEVVNRGTETVKEATITGVISNIPEDIKIQDVEVKNCMTESEIIIEGLAYQLENIAFGPKAEICDITFTIDLKDGDVEDGTIIKNDITVYYEDAQANFTNELKAQKPDVQEEEPSSFQDTPIVEEEEPLSLEDVTFDYLGDLSDSNIQSNHDDKNEVQKNETISYKINLINSGEADAKNARVEGEILNNQGMISGIKYENCGSEYEQQIDRTTYKIIGLNVPNEEDATCSITFNTSVDESAKTDTIIYNNPLIIYENQRTQLEHSLKVVELEPTGETYNKLKDLGIYISADPIYVDEDFEVYIKTESDFDEIELWADLDEDERPYADIEIGKIETVASANSDVVEVKEKVQRSASIFKIGLNYVFANLFLSQVPDPDDPNNPDVNSDDETPEETVKVPRATASTVENTESDTSANSEGEAEETVSEEETPAEETEEAEEETSGEETEEEVEEEPEPTIYRIKKGEIANINPTKVSNETSVIHIRVPEEFEISMPILSREFEETVKASDERAAEAAAEPAADSEVIKPACNDGEDNDGDSFIDLEDTGCEDVEDDDETDPIVEDDIETACNDEFDNDNDGYVDLDDPGCERADDTDEEDPEVEIADIPDEFIAENTEADETVDEEASDEGAEGESDEATDSDTSDDSTSSSSSSGGSSGGGGGGGGSFFMSSGGGSVSQSTVENITENISLELTCLENGPILTFDDIAGKFYGEATIATLSSLLLDDVPLIQGYINEDTGERDFRPYQLITRSEFFKISTGGTCWFERQNFKADECGSAGFTDVNDDDWYKDLINATKCTGVVEGYEDGTVGANNNITRAEALKVILELSDEGLGSCKDKTENPFMDVSEEDWFEDVAKAAYHCEIFQGHKTDIGGEQKIKFKGNEQVTRGEVAILMFNAFMKELQ